MAALYEELKQRISFPPLIAEKAPYLIKFAETAEELLAIQKLRYRVFNEEQGKGLRSSEADGVDRDEYDDLSVHLMVCLAGTDEPVGTYRIILSQDSTESLYSSREFEIRGFDPLLHNTLEVGRSCVAPEHRNGGVVALLWAGISAIMTRSRMRYLTGCVSLEDRRPEAAWALYEYFRSQDLVSNEVKGIPRAPFAVERPQREKVDALLADPRALRSLFPPLLKGYFRMGAKICSEPAFDYEFGTLDFLILLDVAKLPDRYNKHFNVRLEGQT